MGLPRRLRIYLFSMINLVVGVNGTVGSALFKALPPQTFGTSHREPLANNVFHLNLLDEPSRWKFPDITFDTAYLCAGICRMNLCEDDPKGTEAVNIKGMTALIDHLNKQNTYIVFLSTNQVFSGNNPQTLPNTAHDPMNEYGRQKAIIEKHITSHCSRYAIVRLTKVVEPNMALIQNWINLLQQNQSINAFHDMPLAPVSLSQVIETLILIGQKQQNGIYHISGKEDVSYFDLATYVVKQLKHSSHLVQSVSAIDAGIKKIFLPRFTSLDCSSTIALGGKNPPDFVTVLRECFDF